MGKGSTLLVYLSQKHKAYDLWNEYIFNENYMSFFLTVYESNLVNSNEEVLFSYMYLQWLTCSE